MKFCNQEIILKSSRKRRKERGEIFLMIALILCLSVFGVVTKVIYDAIFSRCDRTERIPDELIGLVRSREWITFFNGGFFRLQGYRYVSPNATSATRGGIVVVAPGFRSGADHYLWQIQSFVEYGWDVFSFDGTGCMESAGDSVIGFPQEIYDLDAALSYIEKTFDYRDIFLFGHSRGGYAACGMLPSRHRIAAVVSVSGLNSAMEAVAGTAKRRAGWIAYGNYPFLWLYQAMLFDIKTIGFQTYKAISESTVPVLIIQGTEDPIAPVNRMSIYAHRKQITSERVTYCVCDTPGQNGHTDLMFNREGKANMRLMERINAFYRNERNERNGCGTDSGL